MRSKKSLNFKKMEIIDDNIIEMSLADCRSVFEMLPCPYEWIKNIKNKVLKNGFDDSTDFHCYKGKQPLVFKIRYVNEWAIEWRPRAKIIISNSDENSFKKCRLVSARDHNGILLSKEDISAYNKDIDKWNNKNA